MSFSLIHMSSSYTLVLILMKATVFNYDRNAHKVKCHPSLQKGGCYEVHDIEDLVKVGHSVKGLLPLTITVFNAVLLN